MVSCQNPPQPVGGWQLFPETHKALQTRVNKFLEHNRLANNISVRVTHETSTRFIDWIDHLVLPTSDIDEQELHAFGYEYDPETQAPPGMKIYRHKTSIFFPILLSELEEIECVIKPENLNEFIQILGKDIPIEGPQYAPIRKAYKSV